MNGETTVGRPPIHNFELILKRVEDVVASNGRPRTALVVPHEAAMVAPFRKAVEAELIEPFVIGDEALFRKDAGSHGIDPDKVHLVDINQPDKAILAAAQMAAQGELDLIVAGRINTEDLLEGLATKESRFLDQGHLLTHVAVMKPERYEKLLLLTDALATTGHDLLTLITVTTNAISMAVKMGIEHPKVALLAAVEVVYPQMEATTIAAIISKMNERGQIKGADVDGPLSLDVAVDMEAALGKGVKSSVVAGQADVLVAPSIEAANGMYKAIALYGSSEVGGVLYGGRVPVVVSMAGDAEENQFRSLLVGILAAQSA
jgi:phosphate butyryltransferase